MYSMLIVDDEPLITDGFYDLFIEKLDADLDIYKAYSGREALSWIRRMRIDIVLTDISMPEINGFDVNNEVKQVWPDCKVIFLTSYNDFEYVQQAMRNKSADYILKTEGDDIVLDAVKNAIMQIQQERKNEELLKQARESVKLTFPLLQSKLIIDIAEGWELQLEEISKQFYELEIPISVEQPVFMLIGQVDMFPENMTLSDKMKAVYYIKNVFDKYFVKSASSISVVYQRTNFLILLQPLWQSNIEEADKKIYTDDFFLYIKGSMGSIQALCKDAFGLSISLATVAEAVSWDKFSIVFDFLRMKLHNEAGLINEMLLIYNIRDAYDVGEHMGDSQLEYEVRMQVKKIRYLKDYLESGERTKFLELYTGIMETVGKSKDTSYDMCAEVYYMVSGIFVSYVNRWKMTELLGGSLNIEKFIQIDTHSSWDESVEYFKEIAEKIFKQKNDDSLKNANRIFKFIKNYTEQNIGEDLSLTKFADLLNFHPFYLSRLFKQVTGKNLSEYISDVKMEKAKQMLENTNIKINDITIALGFKTSSYFTKFFRRYTEQSPLEYRKAFDEKDML